MSGIDKRGSLNINSENMFPIIRKWLYQDHDIFMREQISNGCDAVTKLKKLALIGEYEAPPDEKYRVDVTVDPEAHTIAFEDNGIGMDEDEVERYINEVAFSGASDFLEKYRDRANEDQIIGHFGLGFYSAFMVADRVTIDTLSYKPGAESVLWESEDGSEFVMREGGRTSHGTCITLHICEDELKFCNEYQARETIEKYCSFMPVEIYLHDANKLRKAAEEAAKKAEEKKAEGESTGEAATGDSEPKEKPVNDTNPLWNESPSKVTEEQYREFYRQVFRDYREPLFWIHLNMDYPFNLKGILYFPKLGNAYDSIEGTIKLYNNQVFIADNIKEVIPEYLLLLKGCIDCPDLPLNVSRSALQNDGFVQKISDYITKKVSDKLSGMMKTDRENYEKYWDDISPFIKFGCVRDQKFADRMKDAIIFKDLSGKYLSADEYIEKEKHSDVSGGAPEAAESPAEEASQSEEEREKEEEPPKGDDESLEKPKSVIYYVTNEKEQSQYIRMYQKAGRNAVIMNYAIDTPFISWLEMKRGDISFVRIDADLTDDLRGEALTDPERYEALKTLVREAVGDEELDIRIENMKDDSVASMMTMSEEGRRMQEMMKMYALYGMDPGTDAEAQTLVLNAVNPLVLRLIGEAETETPSETASVIAEQLYDLALAARGALSDEKMEKFIRRSQEIMLKL